MNHPLTLGVVTLNGARDTGLAAAVAQHPGVVSRPVTVDDTPAAGIAGLVIDVPSADRQAIVLRLAGRWRVPFLVEAPVALAADGIDAVARTRRGSPLFSENRLLHHLPTRRLRERVAAAADPVEQLFAAWRFRPGALDRGAVVQLIDYLGQVTGSGVARVTAMRRDNPAAFLVSLRYENDAVGSIEIGEHLPSSLPWASELVIECFCRETVYHCEPGNQAITADGRTRAAVDWSEPALEQVVSAFVDALIDGRAPERSLDEDRRALAVSSAILDPAGSLAGERS